MKLEGSAYLVFTLGYVEDGHRRGDATWGCNLSPTTTMTVRLRGGLSDFVAMYVGENGSYENVSEYIRDLIHRDKERLEQQGFERLKAELAHAFAASEASYKSLTVAEVIARNRT